MIAGTAGRPLRFSFEEDLEFRQRSLAAIDGDDDNWWTAKVIWNFFLQNPDVRFVKMDARSSLMGVQDWQKPDLNVCIVSSVPVRPVRGSSKTNEMTGNNRKESQRGIPSVDSGMPQILVEA